MRLLHSPRSRHLGSAILAALALTIGQPSLTAAAPMDVTFLGTGSPAPTIKRFSQSILVEAGTQKLLFDLGRGVMIRLGQLHIPAKDINASFITHMHSDHISGLPDLWMTGWLGTAYGSRTQPMVIYGPKGTVDMAKYLGKAFAENTRIREADEQLPPEGIAFEAHDIVAGPVYQKDGVKVSAFETNHGELIKPNYGYIIEFDGKKAVISSDTTYDERIATAASGADLLIHEVAYFEPKLFEKLPTYKKVQAHHSTPEEAGRIFNMAKPKLAVFTHIIVRLAGQALEQPDTTVVNGARKTYDGPLVAAQDLMRISIGDGGKIQVFDPDKKPVEVAGL